MQNKKPKKQTPKLENVGKMIAVTIFVPLLSSLVIYLVNMSLTSQTEKSMAPNQSSREVPKLASSKSD